MNMDAVDWLNEDLVFEIIRRLPTRSLIRCKLVCKSWLRLILDSKNQEKLPQTVAGFFFAGAAGKRDFISITGGRPPSFKFLPFIEELVAVSDCCNGLILCWCLGGHGYRYCVCSPVTERYEILPPITCVVGHALGEARLCFDPTASSHFHVIENVCGENGEFAGLEIYSSETASWTYKESELPEGTDGILYWYRSPSVFLNGCHHIMGYCNEEGCKIFAVDMAGKTWRKINWPCGKEHSMHLTQGHLCVSTLDDPSDSLLSIWFLEDYDTDNWILKHTVSILELFGSIDIGFGDYVWGNEEYWVIALHPEWNLIFIEGEDRAKLAYDMDRREVHVIPAREFEYVTSIVKDVFTFRPLYLPYVPLFSDSLREVK